MIGFNLEKKIIVLKRDHITQDFRSVFYLVDNSNSFVILVISSSLIKLVIIIFDIGSDLETFLAWFIAWFNSGGEWLLQRNL